IGHPTCNGHCQVLVHALYLHDMSISDKQTGTRSGIGCKDDSILACQCTRRGAFLYLVSNVIGVAVILRVHIPIFSPALPDLKLPTSCWFYITLWRIFFQRNLPAATIFEKIWNDHVVYEKTGGPSLLYIDRHLVHEVTSPQAFEGLRENKRMVRRPDLTFATMDHNVPTSDRSLPIVDQISAVQIQTLAQNCREFGITLFDMNSPNQGIVHVIGPELGLTLPGTTIVCGDSHTSTHGAFGAFALGIGTSDVEHVLATQCLWLDKPNTFSVNLTGKRRNPHAVTSKDMMLYVIRKIGTAGGTGHVLEYRGEAISELSMENRMTICNMSIEAGARAGLVAPDKTTFEFVRGRRYAPQEDQFEKAVEYWKGLASDRNAKFDKSVEFSVSSLPPQVSWGTNPGMVVDVTEDVPDPAEYA